MPQPSSSTAVIKPPRIGLALGGGGARGLAHILVLEALDELGVTPTHIAGTSIGAIYGAAAAAGLTGKQVRAHTEEILGARVDLVKQLFAARAEPVSKLLNFFPLRTSLFNAESLMDLLLPKQVPQTFAELKTPLAIVATDFYAQEQVVIAAGPIRRAVAASMALPAIFTPVIIDGTPMVDGGLVNPLPFDLLMPLVDITIAVDVAGGPQRRADRTAPSAIEVLTASSQIFQRSIVREKLRATQPDVFIACPVDDYSVLDFHRYKEILAAAAPVKEQLKRLLGPILSSQKAETLTITAPSQPTPLASRLPKVKALLAKPKGKR